MLIFFWIIILGATLIKRPRIFPIVVTAFLVKLNYNAVNVADFNAYSSIYNQISSTQLYQTGYGWYILNNLGRILGLDYNLYKVCSITICMIILWIVSKTMVGESSNLIFGLYLLYPALLDAIQLRFFTAMTMVLMGILFLSKQKVWSTIVYVLIVLLAASIHTSVLFYLLFAAYPIISKHREKLKYIVVASAIILMAFKSKLYDLIAFISNDRQMQYLDKSTGVTSGSGYIPVVTVASIFLLYLINHQIFQEISEDISFSETDKKNSEMISGISLMMFFMIPLVMLSGEFFRAFRIMFVLTYISLAILVRNNKGYCFKHISYSDNKIQFDPRVLGLIIASLGFVVNIIHLAPDAFASFF